MSFVREVVMSFHVLPPSLALASVLICVPIAAADAAPPQPPGPRAPHDPASASAPVPQLTYRSPFVTFVDPGSAEVAPWRAINDTVGRIGGWRAYAREAAGKGAQETDAPATRSGPHEGHHDAASVPQAR
jgi:hypothetical protein